MVCPNQEEHGALRRAKGNVAALEPKPTADPDREPGAGRPPPPGTR
jgi:hypothetical protein